MNKKITQWVCFSRCWSNQIDMKRILLLIVIIFSVLNVNSQEIFKRIVIPNTSPETLILLDQVGIDLVCGVNISDEYIQLELSGYELSILDQMGISYTISIDDLTKFYADRAIEDLPKASAKLNQLKLISKSNKIKAKQLKSIEGSINNVGQYTGETEINWDIPDNWKLNNSTYYPLETNHFGGCLTYAMIEAELDLMKTKFGNIISTKVNASPSGQLTGEGRTVWMVRISDNPEIDEPEEPETLYQSLIHSREAATVMNQLYFMWYLLENYDSDPAIKNLVNNHALYFIPVFNPDGFVYNQTVAPDGGGGQRKNRNTSATGSCTTYLEGIDLNRNSAYYWGNGGSSTSSCSDTYMGIAPFSENETQIMRDFFLQHDFKLALNHHSYKNAMLHAYAGTTINNPRPDEYSKYSHDMSFYNRFSYGPSSSISYLNSGNMNDWMLGGPAGTSANGTPTGTGSGKNTLSWTPENGLSAQGTGGSYGGFWPEPSNYLPIAKNAMRMNFLAAYYSGKYAKLHDFNQSDITSISGDLKFAIENLGQNGGDPTPLTNKFTLTITAVSSNITISSSGIISENFTDAQILEQRNVNIGYTLDSGIQPNDKIEYKVTLTNDYAQDNVLYEANIVKYYNPSVLFIDNPDVDNLTNWISSGGSWYNTTSGGYLGTKAITASNTIPYANNQSKKLQMNGSVNLTDIQETLIQFHAKWDLERSFDYVQIEGSTNGTNWTPLVGKYTKPGATDASNPYDNKTNTEKYFQPDNEMLYDGDTQGKWVMEEIVIDESTNSFLYNQGTVFIRFDFNTNGSNSEDSYYNMDFEGFTFDDFKIVKIVVPCIVSVPTDLITSIITSSGASLYWTNIASATFDLRYRKVGTSTWTDVLDISTNSYNISGLIASTNYEAQVRSKCEFTTSNYSASVEFTTSDFVPCVGTVVASYPYVESFENDYGLWNNETTDDIEWTQITGTTPSTGTGPSSGSDGAGYLYTEASSTVTPAGSPYKKAALTSPCFDLTGYKNAKFSFDYHWFGNNIGTASLKLEISNDNGSTYTPIFTKPTGGTSSDSWVTIQNIDLSAYSGLMVKFKFTGITGDSWSSDMAIDNFIITAEIDSSLGIDDEVLNTFKLYPNPSSMGEIKLQMPIETDTYTVSISNAMGQKLFTEKVNFISNQAHIINTSNFKPGIYFVTVQTERGKGTKKMVIE